MISAMAAKERAQPIPIEECSVSKSGFKEVVKAPRGKMWKKFMVSPNFSSGSDSQASGYNLSLYCFATFWDVDRNMK